MKILTKALALVLALAMAFCFVACGSKEEEGSKTGPTAVEKWVEENGDTLLAVLEEQYGEMAKLSISAKGNTIIIDMKMVGVDDIPEDQKELMQEIFAELAPEMASAFSGYEEEIPELEKFTFNVQEEDGDHLASFDVELG